MSEKPKKEYFCNYCGESLGFATYMYPDDRWCEKSECQTEARDYYREQCEREMEEVHDRYYPRW